MVMQIRFINYIKLNTKVLTFLIFYGFLKGPGLVVRVPTLYGFVTGLLFLWDMLPRVMYQLIVPYAVQEALFTYIILCYKNK